MKISSNWKLTFDPAGTPLVILAVGDYIEGELRFPMKRGLEVVDLADATAPFLRLTGNTTVEIQYDLYKTETYDKTARQKVMESLVAVNTLGRKPLRIEVSGISDRYWQFSNCFIHSHNPGVHVDPAKAKLVKGYTITATGLTQVGP